VSPTVMHCRLFRKRVCIASLSDQHHSHQNMQGQLACATAHSGPTSRFDVFLSHNWGNDRTGRDNHEAVKRIAVALKSRGLLVWLDEEQLGGAAVLTEQLASGIDSSTIVACFLTQSYMQKVAGPNEGDSCKKEFKYATLKLKASRMLAVPMEDDADVTVPEQWLSTVAMELGHQLYPCKLSRSIEADSVKWNQEIDKLAARIRDQCAKVIPSTAHKPGPKHRDLPGATVDQSVVDDDDASGTDQREPPTVVVPPSFASPGSPLVSMLS
jgi:hypothetical protein